MTRIPLICGDEYDAFSRQHLIHHWRPGERARIKRRYNKRFRKAWSADYD